VLGRKRYYMMSVALFTVTSFQCGTAPSLAMLIVFRVLQGIGGGGLAPVEQAILVDSFPKEKLGGAFALYSMAIVTCGRTSTGWMDHPQLFLAVGLLHQSSDRLGFTNAFEPTGSRPPSCVRQVQQKGHRHAGAVQPRARSHLG
jgi:MFS family permease